MRWLGAALFLGFCLVADSCSPGSAPPAGRWQGAYQANDTMVLARLEIDARGGIYLSAPDATDIPASADRTAIRARLSDELDTEWGSVTPRQLEFDGEVFRKPGGVAPQLAWDRATRLMTAYVYLGMKPAIHVPLKPVAAFGGDPWR
ncbi:MAG TPA: hypothetical protein VGF97_06195 [Rhizomicrobium sp.]|jgi:hypothetical protein